MSVYTQLSEEDFKLICNQYQLGELVSFEGVADGIENTTYFFSTLVTNKSQTDPESECKWVFTLFEYTNESALPYYLELYDHLYQNGVPVPDPLMNQSTHPTRLITLHGKPGAVFPRLPGRPPKELTTSLCYQCGAALAKFHLAGESYPQQLTCTKGLAFWENSLTAFPSLTEDDKALIKDTINTYLSVHEGLPKTSVHGDLFHDNVLVDDGQLTAIIDLFNASYDYAVLDLAITLNDWTIDKSNNQTIPELYQSLVDGYQSIRKLTDAEQHALPIMQQTAALRFWLSRIDTMLAFESHTPDDDSEMDISTKDPEGMKQLLVALRNIPDRNIN
jgi:homoserine kinase type II